jgi:hypothetical protein
MQPPTIRLDSTREETRNNDVFAKQLAPKQSFPRNSVLVTNSIAHSAVRINVHLLTHSLTHLTDAIFSYIDIYATGLDCTLRWEGCPTRLSFIPPPAAPLLSQPGFKQCASFESAPSLHLLRLLAQTHVLQLTFRDSHRASWQSLLPRTRA